MGLVTEPALTIVETAVFTRRIRAVMDEEEYRLLQLALVIDPGLGAVIPGGGGFRKVRWVSHGRGKRGGARVIYYWAGGKQMIYMLFAFAKNERDDLTRDQLRTLRQVVERNLT